MTCRRLGSAVDSNLNKWDENLNQRHEQEIELANDSLFVFIVCLYVHLVKSNIKTIC